jgi:hypothetical protein
MRLSQLKEVFPETPIIAEALWTSGASQMRPGEVAANAFNPHNQIFKVIPEGDQVLAFLTELFKAMQKSADEDYNKGVCKSIHAKIVADPHFATYKDLLPQVIFPEPVKLRKDEKYGSFPEDLVPLSKMKERAHELRADKMAKAKQIIDMLKSDEAFDPSIKIEEKEGIFWNDVDTPFGRFRIGECPRKIPSKEKSAALLFKCALQDGIRVFVSLNETNESSDGVDGKASDFWENHVLGLLEIPGMKLVKTGQTVLDSVREPQDASQQREQYNHPQVVESTLEAVMENGEKIPFIHLHLDGWINQHPVPEIRLFNVLQKRIFELGGDVWYNCVGGKGRSPTTAVAQWCLRLIHKALQENTPLDELKINIPELCYMAKKCRSGVIGQACQIVDLHEWLGTVYDELKVK